ncbi:hypothetical protein QJQ45_027970 [Haematococcus lacustris]|nr:hypothetical protein QJQ45_027970 [Haematococcus lacustris]
MAELHIIGQVAGASGFVSSNLFCKGSTGERIAAFFVGGNPRLRLEEVVHSPGDRFRLQTVSGGVVHLQLVATLPAHFPMAPGTPPARAPSLEAAIQQAGAWPDMMGGPDASLHCLMKPVSPATGSRGAPREQLMMPGVSSCSHNHDPRASLSVIKE